MMKAAASEATLTRMRCSIARGISGSCPTQIATPIDDTASTDQNQAPLSAICDSAGNSAPKAANISRYDFKTPGAIPAATEVKNATAIAVMMRPRGRVTTSAASLRLMRARGGLYGLSGEFTSAMVPREAVVRATVDVRRAVC